MLSPRPPTVESRDKAAAGAARPLSRVVALAGADCRDPAAVLADRWVVAVDVAVLAADAAPRPGPAAPSVSASSADATARACGPANDSPIANAAAPILALRRPAVMNPPLTPDCECSVNQQTQLTGSGPLATAISGDAPQFSLMYSSDPSLSNADHTPPKCNAKRHQRKASYALMLLRRNDRNPPKVGFAGYRSPRPTGA